MYLQTIAWNSSPHPSCKIFYSWCHLPRKILKADNYINIWMGVVSNIIKDLFELQRTFWSIIVLMRYTCELQITYYVKGNSPWGSIAQQRDVHINVYIYIYTHVLLKYDLWRLYILTSFPCGDRQFASEGDGWVWEVTFGGL